MCQTNVLFQIVKPVFGKICCSQYLYICSRHINFHNVQLSSVVECWTTNLEIPGSNPDANFLVKFQLKKFRFQIWKVVFRIRSVNHKKYQNDDPWGRVSKLQNYASSTHCILKFMNLFLLETKLGISWIQSTLTFLLFAPERYDYYSISNVDQSSVPKLGTEQWSKLCWSWRLQCMHVLFVGRDNW